ncbi:Alpha-D-kanosaminyltransferase [compost metagenome]
MIEAIPQVQIYHPNVRLVIIGVGPEQPYLEELTYKLNLQDSVTFLGDISRKEALEYFQVADVAVVPSLWESFCYVAAEFMAFGRPLVVSAVDSLNELVPTNDYGIKIPVFMQNDKKSLYPGDIAEAICSLIEDTEFASRLGLNARERIYNEFTNNNFCSSIMNLCYELTNQPRTEGVFL